MSNTISEGEIVIKDELPEAESIKILQVPVKIEQIDDTKKEIKSADVVVKIEDNKLERFEIFTLAEENPPNQASTIPVPSRKEHVIFVVPPLESRDDKITCKICNKSITSKENHILDHLYERHLRGHDEKTCKICGIEFQNKRSLRKHSTVHSEPKDFQCDVCKKSFKARKSWWRHKSIHLTEKDFKCSLCEKSFKIKGYLTQHKFVHATEKAFKCSVCDEAFKQKRFLKRHDRKYHAISKTDARSSENKLQKIDEIKKEVDC
jgi:stress-induced morphogen